MSSSRRHWLAWAAGVPVAALGGHLASRWWLNRGLRPGARAPIEIAQEGRTCIPIDGHEPIRGPADALVTVVEFSAYHCPHSARARPVLERVLADGYPDVRVVFKHFPLNRHRLAIPAALAGYAAQQQSAFWRFSDAFFDLGGDMDQLPRLLGELQLDPQRFAADMRSAAAREAIDRDRWVGGSAGVSGTPSFFVNGHFYRRNWQVSDWREVLDAELEAAKSVLAGGVPPAQVYETICATTGPEAPK